MHLRRFSAIMMSQEGEVTTVAIGVVKSIDDAPGEASKRTRRVRARLLWHLLHVSGNVVSYKNGV